MKLLKRLKLTFSKSQVNALFRKTLSIVVAASFIYGSMPAQYVMAMDGVMSQQNESPEMKGQDPDQMTEEGDVSQNSAIQSQQDLQSLADESQNTINETPVDEAQTSKPQGRIKDTLDIPGGYIKYDIIPGKSGHDSINLTVKEGNRFTNIEYNNAKKRIEYKFTEDLGDETQVVTFNGRLSGDNFVGSGMRIGSEFKANNEQGRFALIPKDDLWAVVDSNIQKIYENEDVYKAVNESNIQNVAAPTIVATPDSSMDSTDAAIAGSVEEAANDQPNTATGFSFAKAMDALDASFQGPANEDTSPVILNESLDENPMPDPDLVGDTTPAPEPEPVPDPQPMPDPEPEPMPDPEPEPVPDPQPMPDPEPEPMPDPEPEPVPDPDANPMPDPDANPMPDPDEDPMPDPGDEVVINPMPEPNEPPVVMTAFGMFEATGDTYQVDLMDYDQDYDDSFPGDDLTYYFNPLTLSPGSFISVQPGVEVMHVIENTPGQNDYLLVRIDPSVPDSTMIDLDYTVTDSDGETSDGTAEVMVMNQYPYTAPYYDMYHPDASYPAYNGNFSDWDPEGPVIFSFDETTTMTSLTISGQGTFTITDQATGEFTFLPDPTFVGNATAPVFVSDLAGQMMASGVSIQVDNNIPSDTVSYSYATAGQGYVFTSEVYDSDGDDLTYTLVDASSIPGTITTDFTNFASSGEVIMDIPASVPSGLYEFTYTVNDGREDSELLVFEVEVQNEPPATYGDGGISFHPSTSTPDYEGAVSDWDYEGGNLTFVVEEVIQGNGSLTFDASGSGDYTVTPDPGYLGPLVFRYTATDEAGQTSEGFIDLNVDNSAPYAYGYYTSLTTDDSGFTDYLADYDYDEEDTVTYSLDSASDQGGATLSLNSDGEFTITFADTATDGDAFNWDYTVCDQFSECESNSISIDLSTTI